MSAANQSGEAFTGVLARRAQGGALVLLKLEGQKITEAVIDDSSDHALDLYERLKKSQGEAGKYTAATLFIRSRKTNRRLKFN